MTEEWMNIAQRLRVVRRMERYFLKRWAAQRVHANPRSLDRVAADVRQVYHKKRAAQLNPPGEWLFLVQAASSAAKS